MDAARRGGLELLGLETVDQAQATVVGEVALGAVEQADAFIRTAETGQPEKQSVDCVLIDGANADKYTVFAIEG